MKPSLILRIEGQQDLDLGPLETALPKILQIVAQSLQATGVRFGEPKDLSRSILLGELEGITQKHGETPLALTAATILNAHVCFESTIEAFGLSFDMNLIRVQMDKGAMN